MTMNLDSWCWNLAHIDDLAQKYDYIININDNYNQHAIRGKKTGDWSFDPCSSYDGPNSTKFGMPNPYIMDLNHPGGIRRFRRDDARFAQRPEMNSTELRWQNHAVGAKLAPQLWFEGCLGARLRSYSKILKQKHLRCKHVVNLQHTVQTKKNRLWWIKEN